MTIQQAVILAAGEGQRMRPLTSHRPKVMIPVAGKPILEHLILGLSSAGISDFTLVTGYCQDVIRQYFEDGRRWNIHIHYVQQAVPQGTADAVRQAKDFIRGDFLVSNGDIITDSPNLVNLVSRPPSVMSVIELADVSGLGVVETSDEKVIRIHEKSPNPPSHLANAGLYLFSPAIWEAIENTPRSIRGEYELTDSIQHLIDAGRPVVCHRLNGWMDLAYPWHLLSAAESLMSAMAPCIEGEIEPQAVIKGSLQLGSGSVVRAGAYIVGPVIIGRDCDIGPNCYIRPGTVIGDRCHIGAGVEVKNSIIMSGTKIPHLSYVGDSVIGENCNLGAGTKIANLKLDKSTIVVNGLNTGRRKLGAIIGDNVQTGINSSINVGTLIGNGALIGPGALAKGVIRPGGKVFAPR